MGVTPESGGYRGKNSAYDNIYCQKQPNLNLRLNILCRVIYTAGKRQDQGFIHFFHKSLLSAHHVPGTIVNAGDTVVN